MPALQSPRLFRAGAFTDAVALSPLRAVFLAATSLAETEITLNIHKKGTPRWSVRAAGSAQFAPPPHPHAPRRSRFMGGPCRFPSRDGDGYEFGCKVSVASTSRGNWIVGARALHGNPSDGPTLGGRPATSRAPQRPKATDCVCGFGVSGAGSGGRGGDSHRPAPAPASGEEFTAVDESAGGD